MASGCFHTLFRVFCLTACVWVRTMGQFSVMLKLWALLQQYKGNTEEAKIVPEGSSIFRDRGHTFFYFSSEKKDQNPDNRIKSWFFGVCFGF